MATSRSLHAKLYSRTMPTNVTTTMTMKKMMKNTKQMETMKKKMETMKKQMETMKKKMETLMETIFYNTTLYISYSEKS